MVEFKAQNREQLLAIIAGLLRNTPEEFIDFENITFDLGSEFTVDGSDTEEWYPGAKTRIHAEGRYISNIPIKRKKSVYAYYADSLGKEIEGTKEVAKDLEHTQEMYRALGNGEIDGE